MTRDAFPPARMALLLAIPCLALSHAGPIHAQALRPWLAADSSGADSAIAPNPPWLVGDGPSSPNGEEWQMIAPLPVEPPPRRMHAGWVYDPIRSMIVLFGGWTGSASLNDVWTFSPDDAHWTQLSTSGGPPLSRWGHSMTYDPVRDRMIVFGGTTSYGNDGSLGDVWALSLSGQPTWTEIKPQGTGPSPRFVHTAVYDPSGDRLIVFGGFDGTFLFDVWSLELSSNPRWVQIFPDGSTPPRRDGHVAVYDPDGDRMIVHGGWNGSALGDVWELTLGDRPQWNPLSPSGAAPPARAAHAAAYDPGHHSMIIFGGDQGGANGLNDVWTLSLTGSPQWSEVHADGSPPSRRWGQRGVFDIARGQALFFGGVDLGNWLNDVWAISIDAAPHWSKLFDTRGSPRDRWGHTVVLDRTRDRLLLFGGLGSSLLDDTWQLPLGDLSWRRVFPVGQGPSARLGHSAILDRSRNRMIIFGGASRYYPTTYLNDSWSLDLSDPPVWTELHPEGPSPPARDGHTAIYDPIRERMIVYGGWDDANARSDVWALSLADPPRWTELFPAGSAPPGRRQHAAIYDPYRDAMIVFGGEGGTGSDGRNDVWALSLSGEPAWTVLGPTGTKPSPRWGIAMDLDPARHRALIFGGVDLQDWRNEVWALSLDANPAWSLLVPSGNRPLNRMHASFVNDPGRERMVMFGGWTGQYPLGDTWLFLLDRPVPAAVSLTQVDARPGSVHLTWFIADAGTNVATVQRRESVSEWIAVGTSVPDANGRLEFEDRDVVPGGRYGYRVSIGEIAFEETWVDVPSGAELALAGFQPNPVAGQAEIAFALPSDGSARLAIFDATGRRTWSREVGSLGPGVHRVSLDGGLRLLPGVYLVQLTRGKQMLTRKAIVLAE